ncbi:MAG: glycosyltransferase family 39 protein [Candidatus Acidiferrales bacterium]
MDSSFPIRSRAPEEGGIQISVWSIALIFLVLYVCLFSGLGALGLVGPDEPRYAAIARAMAETRDWVTPRLWGTPWFEKPVLYYWAAGISMRLFGVSEFAERLPSALAALLAVIAVAWTALRSYGVGACRYALLMLPTSVALIGFSRAASPDMLFAGFLAASMAVASEILQRRRPGPLLRIAFGFFLGVATLAKGPAAVILAAGATLLWGALSRRWTAPFRFLHPLIVAVFCVTSLPWYILCALRNPDFFRVFILEHNFARYLTPVFEHRQPFWFYGPVLSLATIPWVVALFGSFFRRWTGDDWKTSPSLFALCWATFPFLFFSFSQSKLPGYILPSIPPLFLFLCDAMQHLFAAGRRGAAMWMGTTGALLALTAVFSEKALLRNARIFSVPDSRAVLLLLLIGIGGLIAVALSLRKRPMAAFTALVLTVVSFLAFMNLEALPAADYRISARAAAADAQRLDPFMKDIGYRDLARNWHFGLNYYFNRELPEWTPGTPPPEWVFLPEKDAGELSGFGKRVREASRAGAPFAVLFHVSPDSPEAQ